MAEPNTRIKLTYEDFLQLPDDGKRHEIIDGEHYVTASPVARHLSPSTQGRDRGIKKKLYERCEVSEYWIVDPKAESIEVFRRQAGGGLERVVELGRAAADMLSTPLLPRLEIPLEELFPS